MAKPCKTSAGYIQITEQHKWHIMVSCGRNWELYDSFYSWTKSKRSALRKLKAYSQFQNYLKNTGRRFKLDYVSVDEFPSRPIYLQPEEFPTAIYGNVA